jgi:SAM-dependent methyltransferase
VRAAFEPVNPGEVPDSPEAYWEAEAEAYYAEHRLTLGDDRLVWCPEGLDEDQVHLLGDVRGRRLLEVGCGAAQGTRWAAANGAQAVGLDLSAGMLRVAQRIGCDGFSLIQADAAALPFAPASFDTVFSAFGALPHVASVADVYQQVGRLLRPGGLWVLATCHPFAWVFPDSPDPADLVVRRSYFDATPYTERDDAARLVYVQWHNTVAGHFEGLIAAGFVIERVIEPEWPAAGVGGVGVAGGAVAGGVSAGGAAGGAADGEFAAWSRARGRLVPSSLIISARQIVTSDG